MEYRTHTHKHTITPTHTNKRKHMQALTPAGVTTVATDRRDAL